MAGTAPVVLSIDYACPDPKIHIGSVMTVYMSSIVPSQTMASVSASALSSTDLNIGSSSLATVAPQTLYITDGTRAWTYVHSGGTSFTINDGNLLRNAPPFSGQDYNTLAQNSFQIYTGTLVRGNSPGLVSLQNVEIGSFDSVVTSDSGGSQDDISDDGIWTGRYIVPDLGFAVANGKFFGISQVNSLLASNSPYQSVKSFSLDGLRPNIDAINFKTNKTNYNGVMYLSKLSQPPVNGGSNPTNAQGRFDVTANKRGTEINISINTPTTKNLQPILIPSNATNLNGWKTWDGTDGAPVPLYAPDNTYVASLYIKDEHGVTGVTKTVQIKVISLKIEVKNVILTPSALNTLPAVSDGLLTLIDHEVQVYNDTNTSLDSSLEVLGWPTAISYNNHAAANGTRAMVAAVNERSFLAPNGSIGIEIAEGHDYSNGDTDSFFAAFFRLATGTYVPECFQNLTLGLPNVTNSSAQEVHVGDGDTGNDWDSPVFDFLEVSAAASATTMSYSNLGVTLTAATDPTLLKQRFSIYVNGDTPPAGSYRLVIRAILSGLDYTQVAPPFAANMPETCAPVNPFYRAGRLHFYPSVRPGPGDPSSFRGYGILAEESSIMFSVNANQAPTSDTTAPLFISSDPQPDSLVPPNVYGPGAPLTAAVQDIETPVNISSTFTNIRLIDPIGSVVGGNSATNGGGSNNSATVSFTPFSPLKIGGLYTMTLNACNQAGLCIQKEIKFEIQDQTPPDVTAVELVSGSSSSPIGLTMLQTGPDGPYDTIKEVWATISMPSTSLNTIDWDQTTISLQRISGTSAPDEPMDRITPLGTVPTDGKVRYRLKNTITDAGTFQVSVQTTSQDASNVSFTGPPATFVKPRFTTIVNVNSLNIRYLSSPIFSAALSGTQPITATTGTSVYNPLSTNTQAFTPNFALLPANSGYIAVTASGAVAHGLQLNFGAGNVTAPISWSFNASNPLRFFVYLDTTDAPAGVSIAADVKLFGFNGITWVQQSVNPVLSGTTYVWTIDVVAGSPIPAVYGLFYSSIQPNVSPTSSPTAVPFAHTRSFNPSHPNAAYRRARIYYSDMAPKEVEVKIFDTSGALVRGMALGNGVNATDVQTDPVYLKSNYFFTWDGSNDTGNVVKNGIYLIRFRVTKVDNSTETQVKLVALVR